MPTHYTLTYTVRARNVSQLALAAALALQPLDPNLVDPAVGGLSIAGPGDDTTTLVGTTDALRTIKYTSLGTGVIPDPQMADNLVDYYTSSFSRALVTPVVPGPVLVTP